MNINVEDLSPTIVPRSDQLNADDLLSGPITVTITGIRGGSKEQPVDIQIDGGHQPYKPGKSMRRVLITAWGIDGREWVGRSMTLYNDPEVVFGGVKVGGIRISHLSHIDREFVLMLTVTRGKKIPFRVQVMRKRTEELKRVAKGVDPRVDDLMNEAVRGELKRALATYAPERKFSTLKEVRSWLCELDAESLGPICEAVLPPATREPGDESEEF